MSVTATYKVTGMTCGHCEASVREEIEELDGVESVAVDRETGTAVVTSAAALQPDLVVAAVKEAGFDAEPMV